MSVKLDDIKNWPAHQTKEEEWATLRQKGIPSHNCYFTAFGNVYQVKMGLGGQRVLGVSANAARAARFADMAILHFLPYRHRRNRAPVDSDFNFGMASAQKDLQDIPEARAILETWEKLLVNRNLIHKAKSDLVFGAPPKSLDAVRRDLNTFFRQYEDVALHASGLLASVPDAEIILSEWNKTIRGIHKFHVSVDKLLVEHASDSDPECVRRRTVLAATEKAISADAELRAAMADSLANPEIDPTAIENIKL